MAEGTPENRKGGWVTSTTPSKRRKPEKHFKLFSLSPANVGNSLENAKLFFLPSMMAERTMVMTGQVKMMQRASGTGMKLTLARQVMEEMAPTRPENI